MRMVVALLSFSLSAWAIEPKRPPPAVPSDSKPATEPEKPATPLDASFMQTSQLDNLKEEIRREKSYLSRSLSSGDSESDINHYKSLSRRLGVDAGIMMPYGDFAKEFASAPVIGIHFTWEAIRPLNLVVSTYHASAPRIGGPHLGRLTASSISMGANAIWDLGRAIPFFRLEASFDFNDVSLGNTYVTSGSDSAITTLGANIGGGIDFVVGREFSFGLQVFYHLAVPKKVTLSDSTQFDLGSSYAVGGLRINF